MGAIGENPIIINPIHLIWIRSDFSIFCYCVSIIHVAGETACLALQCCCIVIRCGAGALHHLPYVGLQADLGIVGVRCGNVANITVAA